jgi:hypothetical protein
MFSLLLFCDGKNGAPGSARRAFSSRRDFRGNGRQLDASAAVLGGHDGLDRFFGEA